MNAETFAEWLERQGYQVFRSESSYWYNAGPKVLQAFPYHWQIEPTAEELKEITQKNHAIALRFSRPFSSGDGKVSYHVVARLPYALETLKSQGKNGVRKGLAQCRIEQIPFSFLAKAGWKLQQDTLTRQQRLKSMTQKYWETCCLSAEGLPGFEAWAAFVDGELAASILTARIDNTWTIPYAQSHRDFLGMHVNNALFFMTIKKFLETPGITEVFTNLQSLDAPESVDEFKFRMGLVPKPVRQQIYFNPLVRPMVGAGSYSLVKKVQHARPDSLFWAKAEGIFRFYLEGKKTAAGADLTDVIEEDHLSTFQETPET